MTTDTWNGFSSIAHFPLPIETQGDFLIYRWNLEGLSYIRIYRGTPDKCRWEGQYKVTKTGRLTHTITGQRFGSVEKAVAFYQQQEVK